MAEAVGVPLEYLFYGDLESSLTPRLTPRMSLQELDNEPPRFTSAFLAALLNPQIFISATKKLRSILTLDDGGLMGKNPKPPTRSSNPPAQAEADPGEKKDTSKPEA